MLSYKDIYNDFISQENSGNIIGLFRITCAIFGGLLVAYLGMTLLAFLTPGSLADSAIIPILFYPLVWACTALWISLSPSKSIALSRVIMPSLIFYISIYLFYKN